MSTQRGGEIEISPRSRSRSGERKNPRPAKRRGSVAQSITGTPAASPADDVDRRESWLSIATILAVIALADYGAAAVAANYGPVFTQPSMVP